MPRETIELVMQEYAAKLMLLHGVVGIAIGKSQGKLCIRVFVVRKTDELLQQIPSTLRGYTAKVEERGEFQALSQ